MANREELLIIRAARAGEASAQLNLGKRYLFGSEGLPKSLPTALYWLDRAAQQDEADAWLLIGKHVPFETVQQTSQPSQLYVWYERAFDAGVAQAGLVLAKLVLGQVGGAVSEAMRNKALRALQVAAHAGIAEAQWLLAQTLSHSKSDKIAPWAGNANEGEAAGDAEDMLAWAMRAARSGVAEAQYALAEHAWASGDQAGFLKWGLPLARHLLEQDNGRGNGQASPRDASLAVRCARALFLSGDFDAAEVSQLLEIGARAGDRGAQYSLGLWLARMDANGKRISSIPGLANYKKSIRWLSLAAGQGMAEAWFALSRIYQKPECSQRSIVEAQRCLEMAAKAGHGAAQMALGMAAWRARREQESNDIRAAEWLQKAASQGVDGAREILLKVAPPASPAQWAQDARQRLTREMVDKHPLLAARIDLAALFGLSRSEALLIDVKAADQRHCLVVDVRALHPHSKRRLILVETAQERQALDRIASLFEGVNCGPDGPEGNYRQRLYRLKTLLA